MMIVNYDTAYCKDILWVVICAMTESEAIEKLHSLIYDVSEVRSVWKQF